MFAQLLYLKWTPSWLFIDFVLIVIIPEGPVLSWLRRLPHFNATAEQMLILHFSMPVGWFCNCYL